MNLDAYLAATDTTAVYPDAGKGNMAELTYLALGLAGETGEAVDVVKKALRNDGQMTPDMALKLAGELGDVLWYWVRLVRAAGFDADGILLANVGKLAHRKASGTLKVRA